MKFFNYIDIDSVIEDSVYTMYITDELYILAPLGDLYALKLEYIKD